MTRKRHLLVTAGPTREMLDPVRYLSNLSTGEMGYHVARVAAEAGFHVTLISGPTMIARPRRVHFVPVVSAHEMEQAVKREFRRCDALVMTAAVCDYTPAHRSSNKIKRIHRKSVLFRRTTDILKSVGKHKGKRYVVGFCLETENVKRNAIRKLRSKNLDLIVTNAYGKHRHPFGRNKVAVTLIDRQLREKHVPRCDKRFLAKRLIGLVKLNIRA